MLPFNFHNAVLAAKCEMDLFDIQHRLPDPAPKAEATTPPSVLPLFKSPAECHRYIRAHGINIREFCDERGISYQAARELLIGKAKGRRGENHKAAVALGLKPAPTTIKLAA